MFNWKNKTMHFVSWCSKIHAWEDTNISVKHVCDWGSWFTCTTNTSRTQLFLKINPSYMILQCFSSLWLDSPPFPSTVRSRDIFKTLFFSSYNHLTARSEHTVSSLYYEFQYLLENWQLKNRVILHRFTSEMLVKAFRLIQACQLVKHNHFLTKTLIIVLQLFCCQNFLKESLNSEVQVRLTW